MPTSRTCDYCEKADHKTEPVATKAHGTLYLCERCKNLCQAKGWLKQQEAA